jgi:hypothetical protein
MMINKSNTINKVALLLGIFSVMLSACTKNDTPPVLPPLESFKMDFSNFQEEKSTELFIGNWAYSTATVSIFNIYASATIIVPAAAYNIALDQVPEYIGDDQWLWSFDFPVYGANYQAKLTATAKRKGKTHWEMRIDRLGTNAFTNFLWFEGETVADQSAEWTIYDSPTSPVEVISTNWEKYDDSNNGTLRYTLTRSGDSYYNSTIEWGIANEGNYNRFYNIYRSDENTDISILWNIADGSGRVKSPKHFNDEEWHCWNKYLLDDTCY